MAQPTYTAYASVSGLAVITLTIPNVVVGAGDRILVRATFTNSGITAPGANFNTSEALSVIHNDVIGSGATQSRSVTLEIATPSATTADVVISWTTAANASASALVIHGSDTSRAASTNTALGTAVDTAATVTLVGATGRLQVAVGSYRDTSTGVVAAGDSTLEASGSSGTGASHAMGWFLVDNGGASESSDATIAASRTWQLRAYDFTEAAAGGGTWGPLLGGFNNRLVQVP